MRVSLFKRFVMLPLAMAYSLLLWAGTEEVDGYTWTWRDKNNGTVEVCGLSTLSNPRTITIPPVLGGKAVTSIGAFVFRNNRTLISVMIPPGVTEIADSAFAGCSRLAYIKIPDGVTSIGHRAFYGCNGLASIQLPDSVMSIGDGAFEGCHNLGSIAIPGSVKYIGDYAFHWCSGLKRVDISDLGAWCGIAFGRGVLIGNPLSEGHDLYLNGSRVTDLTIPSGVVRIRDRAFYGCSIETLTIPAGVTSIGNDAFRNCNGLKRVSIPDCVKFIGDDAFRACRGLSVVILPDSMKSVGESAFFGCENLSLAMVPESLRDCVTLENQFEECSPGLQLVFYKGRLEDLVRIEVKLDANKGKLGVKSVEAFKGYAVGGLPIPVRDKFRFKGWFTDISDGELVTDKAVFNEGVTLHAHWEAHDFEFGDGSEWIAEQNGSWRTKTTDNTFKKERFTLITTQTGHGILSYEWKISSVSILNTFAFYVDGVSKANLRGNGRSEKLCDWVSEKIVVESGGPHTFKWMYEKRVGDSSDNGWIRNISWTPVDTKTGERAGKVKDVGVKDGGAQRSRQPSSSKTERADTPEFAKEELPAECIRHYRGHSELIGAHDRGILKMDMQEACREIKKCFENRGYVYLDEKSSCAGKRVFLQYKTGRPREEAWCILWSGDDGNVEFCWQKFQDWRKDLHGQCGMAHSRYLFSESFLNHAWIPQSSLLKRDKYPITITLAVIPRMPKDVVCRIGSSEYSDRFAFLPPGTYAGSYVRKTSEGEQVLQNFAFETSDVTWSRELPKFDMELLEERNRLQAGQDR